MVSDTTNGEVKGATWELELVPIGMSVRKVVDLGEPTAARVIVDIQPSKGKVAFTISGSGPSMAKPQELIDLLQQVVEEARTVYDGSEEAVERGEV